MSQTADTSEHRFLLGALAAGHMTNDWVAGTLWILAPAIAASMGLGPTEVGLILAINGLGAGLAYIPAGIIADRSSHPGWLMMMTFWWVAIGYFCATLVPGFWGITLMLAVGVMGDAFWHPVATGVLVKTMPTQRAQVLGIHAVGGSIGAEVLGPITTGFLLGYFSWQTSLQILVLPAIIMGIVFIYVARRIGTVAQQKMSAVDFRELLRRWGSRRGVQLIALMICYNMALMATLAMTPLSLQNDYALSPFVTSIVFAGILLVGTALQPIAGKRSDRKGRRRVILGILIVAVIASMVAAFSSGLILFLFGIFSSIVVLTAVRPVVLAAAVDFSSKSEATTLGIVFATLDGVGALGALCGGMIGEFGLQYAYAFAAAMACLSALLCALFVFESSQVQVQTG